MVHATITENKREFFRHPFSIPVCAEMRISSIGGKLVETKKTLICVKDIGAGGLRFETNLQLPVRNDVVLTFYVVLKGVQVQLEGTLVRAEPKGEDVESYFQYGSLFQFSNEEKRQELMALVNQLALAKRKGWKSECIECSLLTECYKSTSQKKTEYHLE